MQRAARLWIIGFFMMEIAGAICCPAARVCQEVAFLASVAVPPGELTLADLLAPGACWPWRREAAKIRLGEAPRAGTTRVLDGDTIRGAMRGLEAGFRKEAPSLADEDRWRIPERVEIRRAGKNQDCEAIAQLIDRSATSASANLENQGSRNALHCAAAHGIPASSSLQLLRTSWNAGLQRWEFALRCSRVGECVPFTVWAEAKATADQVDRTSAAWQQRLKAGRASGTADPVPPGLMRQGPMGKGLIRPGEAATLVWDQAGIRVALPVTCLDGGEAGQSIRVRVKNSNRLLRAQVVGAGSVRAGL